MNRAEVAQRFKGKTVAIVGSGPGCVDNEPGFVDSHDIVVRVNNYRLVGGTGNRTDVFYSFFGLSIKKTREELVRDGVTLCMCKCPNAHAIQSDWHVRTGRSIGVDFRPHYERRKDWWFCDTYIPTVEEFLVGFDLLGRHIPTTGFAAILDVISFAPKSVYLTGFDFFRSRIHNVSDRWRPKFNGDPIGHAPEAERAWLMAIIGNHPITCDDKLDQALGRKADINR